MSARAFLAALLFVPAVASAQETGGYLGVDIAYSRAGINTANNESTAYGAFAGYFATRNFAVELGYRELGDFGGLKADAISAAGLWLVPMNDRLDLYFKVGVARTDAQAGPLSSTRTAALVGAGFQYDLARSIFGRLAWERYPKVGGSSTGEGNVDLVGLGLGLRF
jgi:outer membrane immunogenic protein